MSDRDFGAVRWRKSSRSAEHGTNCLEVAVKVTAPHIIARDSKDPTGPVLGFSRVEWGVFLDEVKRGALDHM